MKCASCRIRETPSYRSVCEYCYPSDETEIKCACRVRSLEQEIESTANKLSDVWLLLDDIARSQRDSDQTRMMAAAVLMKQQCPGWKEGDR